MLINFLFPSDEENGSDPAFVSGTVAPPIVDQFFRLIGSIIAPSFNEIGSSIFRPAHRHRPNGWITERSHNLGLVAGAVIKISRYLLRHRVDVVRGGGRVLRLLDADVRPSDVVRLRPRRRSRTHLEHDDVTATNSSRTSRVKLRSVDHSSKLWLKAAFQYKPVASYLYNLHDAQLTAT